MVGFIFGGNTGVTQAELNRQREIAQKLASSRSGAPRNVGEGLSFLGEALAYRIAQSRANKMDSAMDDATSAAWESLSLDAIPSEGGLNGQYSPPAAPAPAPPSVPDTMAVDGIDPALGFGNLTPKKDAPAPDMAGTPLLGFGATSPTLAGVGGEDPTMKGTPTLAPNAVAPLLMEALEQHQSGPQQRPPSSMGDAVLGFGRPDQAVTLASKTAPGAFAGVVDAGSGYTVVSMPDGSTVRREGSRAWRNNNPGNIEYGDFARSHGAVGTDGRFAVFPDYETGRQAKYDLLFNTGSYRGLTIEQAINRYAPPSENDSGAYSAEIARAAGVPVGTPLTALNEQQRQSLLDAMERVEGFTPGAETVVGVESPN